MKKLLTSTIIALMCKFSIGQKLVQSYYDWNKIHPKEVYYVNAAGQKNGAYKLYDASGVVIKEYNFLNGAENGLCIDYVVTGNNQRVVAAKGSFINGQPNGAYVQYCDEDGYKSKVQEGRYKNGEKTGKWKEWWCNEIYDNKYVNILKSVGVYKDGQYDSVWSFYNKKGQIEKTIRYRNGIGDAEWTKYLYDNTGTLRAKGICIGDDADNSAKKNGLWSFYNPDGSLTSRGNYNYNHEWGLWSFYTQTDSTKPVNTGEFIYGRNFGDWKYYFDKDFNFNIIPMNAAYYRVISFDSSGTVVGNAKDFSITGEKLWEGSIPDAELRVFKKH